MYVVAIHFLLLLVGHICLVLAQPDDDAVQQ
jgi:hypothetical protein